MDTAADFRDIGDSPMFYTPSELAKLMRTTTGALTQDRYLKRGVPFIKNGRRIIYARADVIAFLKRNRRECGNEDPDETPRDINPTRGNSKVSNTIHKNLEAAGNRRPGAQAPRSAFASGEGQALESVVAELEYL